MGIEETINPYVGLLEELNKTLNSIDAKTKCIQSNFSEESVENPLKESSPLGLMIEESVILAAKINNRLKF